MKKFIKGCIANGDKYNWQSMMVDPFLIIDNSTFDIDDALLGKNKLPDTRTKTYLTKISEGVLFPPISITKDNVLIDGTHRLAVHKKLKKKVWAIKKLGKGNGKVFGKWTGKSTYPFEKAEIQMKCINCGANFLHQGKSDKLGPIGAVPEGLPSGELWVCKECGSYFSRNSAIWSK